MLATKGLSYKSHQAVFDGVALNNAFNSISVISRRFLGTLPVLTAGIIHFVTGASVVMIFL